MSSNLFDSLLIVSEEENVTSLALVRPIDIVITPTTTSLDHIPRLSIVRHPGTYFSEIDTIRSFLRKEGCNPFLCVWDSLPIDTQTFFEIADVQLLNDSLFKLKDYLNVVHDQEFDLVEDWIEYFKIPFKGHQSYPLQMATILQYSRLENSGERLFILSREPSSPPIPLSFIRFLDELFLSDESPKGTRL